MTGSRPLHDMVYDLIKRRGCVNFIELYKNFSVNANELFQALAVLTGTQLIEEFPQQHSSCEYAIKERKPKERHDTRRTEGTQRLV